MTPFLRELCGVITKHLDGGRGDGITIFDDIVLALTIHTAGCLSAQDRAELVIRVLTMYPPAVEVLVVNRKSGTEGVEWDIEDTGRPA